MLYRYVCVIGMLPLLASCVGVSINGVELSPTGLATAAIKAAAKGVVRQTRSTLASGRAQRLHQELTQSSVSVDKPISSELVKLIETDYQTMLDQVVDRVHEIQENAPAGSPLLTKGKLKHIHLVVVNNAIDDINAWSRDDLVSPTIFVPSGFIVRSLLRLQAEQEQESRNAKDMFSRAFVGFTSYVPYLEFEEMMRFIISHEATHIWLHRPGMNIRDREIEADAWAVALSSSLSEAFDFKVKAGVLVASGGFSTSDPLDFSLLSTRTGFDVLDYLYGESGALSQSADRETIAERRKSVEAKHSDVFDKHMGTLKDSDVIIFKVMRNLLSLSPINGSTLLA